MPQGAAWTEIKEEIAPKSKKFIPEHKDLFYYYILERYNIYRKRQAGLPQPWTDDPILRNNHFTNVFRLHDRGTQWLINRVWDGLDHMKDSQIRRILMWRVIQYRLPNHNGLFEEYSWIPLANFNAKKLLWRCNQMTKKKKPWFTNAHITLQSNFGQTRAKNYRDYLKGIHDNFESMYKEVTNADTMEEAFKLITKQKGIGGFGGYEILVDLCYLGVLPDEFRDQFANAGPGCKEGLNLIYPQLKYQSEYLVHMEKLRDEQDFGFLYHDIEPPPERLTVQDIEFCLCEFQKYVKTMYGTGRKRIYRPHETK